MARLRKGSMGVLSGVVGPLVLCGGQNGPYLRSRPRRQKGAVSVAQGLSQCRLALGTRFVKGILPMVRVGYGALVKRGSAYNLALQQVLRQAMCDDGERVWIDVEHVVLAQGALVMAEGVSWALEAGGLRVSWSSSWQGSNGAADDALLLALYDEVRQEWLYRMAVGQRSDGSYLWSGVTGWLEQEAYLFLGFIDESGQFCSTCPCVGRVHG